MRVRGRFALLLRVRITVRAIVKFGTSKLMRPESSASYNSKIEVRNRLSVTLCCKRVGVQLRSLASQSVKMC